MEHNPTARQRAPTMGELAAQLRGQARKLTGSRQAILEVLRGAAHPLSIREVFNQLLYKNCDLATVYRAMHLLEQLGLAKRFDLADGVARYELLREGDDGHHHHLVCTECAAVVEIDECSTAELEQRIATSSGFKAVTHKLEFFGICPSCQENEPEGTNKSHAQRRG